MDRSKVVSNFLWRFFERFGAQTITIVVNIILARQEIFGTDKTVTVRHDFQDPSGFLAGAGTKSDAVRLARIAMERKA